MNADLLEGALIDLGAHLDLPTGHEHFADEVLAMIAATEATEATEAAAGRGRRIVVVAAAVVLVVVAAAVLSVGSAREAVADWLGLGIVPVQLVDDLPADATSSTEGPPVSLDQARESVDFPLLLPAEEGAPEAVFLEPATEQVTMRWDDGLTVTQQPSDLVWSKQISAETSVDAVMVRGQPGLWLSGELHVVDGEEDDRPPRLVPNTLAWEEGGVLVRIEIKGTLGDAQTVAASLS